MFTPTPQFKHQAETWLSTRHMLEWAILWEQGTGKTKLILDTVGWLYAEGKVDCLLVVAPSGVHRNWVTDEIPKYLPESFNIRAHVWQGSSATTQKHRRSLNDTIQHDGLAVIVMTYDSVITELGKKALWEFLRKRKTFMVLDESTRIKTPSARRTKVLLGCSDKALYKRILTGTPIVNSPFDIYSQIKFLDSEYWSKTLNVSTFAGFKVKFGVWIESYGMGRTFDQLVSYRDLPQLQDALKGISSRVTKEEVLDLPPKMYTKRNFQLTPVQQRLYEQLKTDMVTWLNQDEPCTSCGATGKVEWEGESEPCGSCEGTGKAKSGEITAPLAIVKLLRMQQVLCGYVQTDNEDDLVELPGSNPRLEALLEAIEEQPGKIIVWARFRRDIDLIMRALIKAGRKPVRYDGAVDENERAANKHAFQFGDADIFVSNPSVGAEGLTLTAARTVIYYNNTFKLQERLQSEDRAHRIGQNHSVLYIDIVAPETIDEKVLQALREKMNVAGMITGDILREWVQ